MNFDDDIRELLDKAALLQPGTRGLLVEYQKLGRHGVMRASRYYAADGKGHTLVEVVVSSLLRFVPYMRAKVAAEIAELAREAFPFDKVCVMTDGSNRGGPWSASVVMSE